MKIIFYRNIQHNIQIIYNVIYKKLLVFIQVAFHLNRIEFDTVSVFNPCNVLIDISLMSYPAWHLHHLYMHLPSDNSC